LRAAGSIEPGKASSLMEAPYSLEKAPNIARAL
jgi:hypothetical protein